MRHGITADYRTMLLRLLDENVDKNLLKAVVAAIPELDDVRSVQQVQTPVPAQRNVRSKSVNSLVPNEDAELALLRAMVHFGGEADTGDIVDWAMAQFPQLTPEELGRTVPAGREWWSGRFRFDLSNLGKKGQAEHVARGRWRITPKGAQRLSDHKGPTQRGGA